MKHSEKHARAPERPRTKKRSLLGRIVRLLLAPFFFVFRMVFTMVLLSVTSFLIFYFYMQQTPERAQQYEKIMAASEQLPAVLGGLAQQAGMGEMAKTLGYEPKAEDTEKSKEMLKNLCAQLQAVDEAEPLPWKNEASAPGTAPREDEGRITPPSSPVIITTDEPEELIDVPAIPEEDPETAEEAVIPAEPLLPPDAVPAELTPIIDALKKAKNLDTIKSKLSVQYVGQHGEGSVLFLDKLLEKDQGLLRLAALDSLRRINTPEALEILYKYTNTQLPPGSIPVPASPDEPGIPATPQEPAAW